MRFHTRQGAIDWGFSKYPEGHTKEIVVGRVKYVKPTGWDVDIDMMVVEIFGEYGPSCHEREVDIKEDRRREARTALLEWCKEFLEGSAWTMDPEGQERVTRP